jgi:hypothetical protein
MVKFSKFQASLVKEAGSISIDILSSLLHSFIEDLKLTISNEKLDVSLIRLICNILESGLIKKKIVDKKIDKKNIVIDEYIKLKTTSSQNNLTYNFEDKKSLENLIEDLHNTGQIKTVSTKRYLCKILKNNILKK